ncbi:MAG: hypothetical protein IJ311_06325 [Elusimicrobiaceae bacterium]|nr:hypothetical protein [Elusimicrobiaceae bacterium]
MSIWQELCYSLSARAAQAPAPFVVVIDGRCCSGKTSLAAYLGEKLGAPVLHIDDFYLPFAYRTALRLDQVGGHIHAERFREEILGPVSEGKEIIYRAYRAHSDTWEPELTIPPHPLYVVEGSYALLPLLEEFYHYKIFLTVDPITQESRLLKREGPEKAAQFLSRWIVAEEKYFAACEVRSHADAAFDTSDCW